MTTRWVLLDRLPSGEQTFILDALRQETVGGVLLLVAAVIGLGWANSPWSASYAAVQNAVVGPQALHLDLSLSDWAGDGLLAIFFFIAGLELKREVVVGTMRKPSAAVLPVVAAVCGMVVPAIVYLAVAHGNGDVSRGWAVPTATDIAFALAVLAVVGSNLPPAVRAFLLTLAIVDDMGAILIIAVVYTAHLNPWPLVGAAVGLAAYAALQHFRVRSRWVYVPLVLAIWALVHASGVHATLAGVAIGLLTRVRPDAGEEKSPAERLEHRLRPWSAAVAVPIFALLTAGVQLTGGSLSSLVSDPAALGVLLGLVVGKFVGVMGGTWLVVTFTRAELAKGLAWADIAAVSSLAGIGFTVSLLIAELAFDEDPTRLAHVKVGVLLASVLAAVIAGVQLRFRDRLHVAAQAESLAPP